MRRADGVEVMTFHQQDILYHALNRDSLSVHRMRVMAVCAFEISQFAVHIHFVITHLHATETEALCGTFHYLTACIVQQHVYII